jgi:hypothetical protein
MQRGQGCKWHDGEFCVVTPCAQSHALLRQWADSITPEEVNALAASYLAYISHYGAEGEVLKQAAAGERAFGGPGPVRATAIVACLPAFTDPSGHSSGALCCYYCLHCQ